MKYSIKQLSELAHVAQSTVSKALNGQKGVSEEKRREILALAKEINYTPNATARALAHQKTESIGIVIPSTIAFSTTNLFWAEFIVAVAEEANKQNYNVLLLIPTKENPLKNIENAIQKKTVDGLIIPAEQLTIEEINLLTSNEIPFVLQGKSVLSDACTVDVRNEDGAEKLTRKLVEKGAESIGCIAGPESFLYTQERVAGFKKVLSENNIKIPKIAYANYDRDSAIESTKSLFKENKNIDSLFIAAGGEFAFYVFEALKEIRGSAENFPMVIFDDYLPFRYLPYDIIAARQPIREMGAQDTKNLLQMIKGEAVPSLSLFDLKFEN